MAAPRITLVVGGARSGKSKEAEHRAAKCAAMFGGGVTYLATGPVLAEDDSWAARVNEHRRRRPATWTTVELDGGDLPRVLMGLSGTVLVDSLGTWVASAAGFEVDGNELCEAVTARAQTGRCTVLVSDEVGLGVHPSTELGVRFRDVLGGLNQAVGSVADQVILVVAGRVLEL